jgi:mxaJ protein
MIFAGGIPIKINGLRNLIIGVQMVGSDAMNTPPAHALARRGIVQNVRGYMLYGDYRQPHPPSAIIDAVEDGDVDVAVVWGPMAGYFAALGSKPLTVDPVEPMGDGTDLPMAFYVSMGVRRGDNALLQRLDDSLERNRAAISAILADYHVPLLPDAFATH